MISSKRPAASGVPKTITAVEGRDHVVGTVAFSVPLDLSALLALRHNRFAFWIWGAVTVVLPLSCITLGSRWSGTMPLPN